MFFLSLKPQVTVFGGSPSRFGLWNRRASPAKLIKYGHEEAESFLNEKLFQDCLILYGEEDSISRVHIIHAERSTCRRRGQSRVRLLFPDQCSREWAEFSRMQVDAASCRGPTTPDFHNRVWRLLLGALVPEREREKKNRVWDFLTGTDRPCTFLTYQFTLRSTSIHCWKGERKKK